MSVGSPVTPAPTVSNNIAINGYTPSSSIVEESSTSTTPSISILLASPPPPPPASSSSSSTSSTPLPPLSNTSSIEYNSSSVIAPPVEVDSPKQIVLLKRSDNSIIPPSSSPSSPSTPSSIKCDNDNHNVLPESNVVSPLSSIPVDSILAPNVNKSSEEEGVTKPEELEASVTVLDHALVTALSHPRDRILLLRTEFELELFLADPLRTRLPLSPPYFTPSLNSYQRLLIHRLADTFGITREVEPLHLTSNAANNWNVGGGTSGSSGGILPVGVVVLVKGGETRLPPRKLVYYVPHAPIHRDGLGMFSPTASSASTSPLAGTPTPIYPSPSLTTRSTSLPPVSTPSFPSPSLESTPISPPAVIPAPQIFKILPRGGFIPSSSSSSSTTSSSNHHHHSSLSSSLADNDDTSSSTKNGRNGKTLEERELAYKEARERIFKLDNLSLNPSDPSSNSSEVLSPVGGEDSVTSAIGGGSLRPSAKSFDPMSVYLQQAEYQPQLPTSFIPIQVTGPPPPVSSTSLSPEPYSPSIVAYPLPQSTRTASTSTSTSNSTPSIPALIPVWPIKSTPVAVSVAMGLRKSVGANSVVVGEETEVRKEGYIMRFSDGALAYSSVAAAAADSTAAVGSSTFNSKGKEKKLEVEVKSGGSKKKGGGSSAGSVSSSSSGAGKGGKEKGKGKEIKKKLSMGAEEEGGSIPILPPPHPSLPRKPTWVTTLPPVERLVLPGTLGTISGGTAPSSSSNSNLEVGSSYSNSSAGISATGGEESSERGSSVAGDGNGSIRTSSSSVSIPFSNSTHSSRSNESGGGGTRSPIIYSPTSTTSYGNSGNGLLSSTITPTSFFPPTSNTTSYTQQQHHQQPIPNWWDPNLRPPPPPPPPPPHSSSSNTNLLSQQQQQEYYNPPYPQPAYSQYQPQYPQQYDQTQTQAGMIYEQQLQILQFQQQQLLLLQQKQSEDELMSMGEMRRPPPRSTELFDPSRRGVGTGGGIGGIRRTSSGPGSSRAG